MSLFQGMSLLATSAYFSAKDDDDGDAMPILGVLPLVSVLLVAFSYHIGLGPIPWSYTGTEIN